jgi:hypothetical protein
MVSKATPQIFLVLVLITNPTNTKVLLTKRKSGKCDYSWYSASSSSTNGRNIGSIIKKC